MLFRDKKYLIIVLLMCILFWFFGAVRPYNSVEINLATVFYTSYSNLRADINAVNQNLNYYIETQDNDALLHAIRKIELARDNMTFFRLAQQSNFRNTILNQKVEKPPFTQEDLEKFYIALSDLQSYIEDVRKNPQKSQGKLIVINKIVGEIVKELEPKNIGYDPSYKAFKVELSNEQYTSLVNSIEELNNQL